MIKTLYVPPAGNGFTYDVETDEAAGDFVESVIKLAAITPRQSVHVRMIW